MLEHAIHAHLSSKTAITDVVVDRIALGLKIQDNLEFPLIQFDVADCNWQSTIAGDADDLQYPVVEFVVRSASISQLLTLSTLVLRAIQELVLGATITLPDTSTANIEDATILDGFQNYDDELVTLKGSEVTVYSRGALVQFGFRYDLSAVT